MPTIAEHLSDKLDLATSPRVKDGSRRGSKSLEDEENLWALIEASQATVARDKDLLESSGAELAAVAEGPLEKGTGQQLLRSAEESFKDVEDTLVAFRDLPGWPGEDEPLDDSVLDLRAEAAPDTDKEIEAEMLRLMQTEPASVSVIEEPPPVQRVAPEAVPVETAAAPPSDAADRLNQARASLLAAETTSKDRNSTDYLAAQKEYQEARAEVVVGQVEKWLEEQTTLSEARAAAVTEKRGYLQRGYDAYKKLGDWNLGALLGTDQALRAKAGDKLSTRVLKGAGRFATRAVSARSVISAAMLGTGLYFGAGAAVGVAALAGRRGLSGLGAGVGAYDLMKVGRERRGLGAKGMRKELTSAEAKELSPAELLKRIQHFEQAAGSAGQKVSENATYNLLKEGLKDYWQSQRPDGRLDDLMKQADQDLNKLNFNARSKDTATKLMAVWVGALLGSGGINLISEFKDHFGGASSGVAEASDLIETPSTSVVNNLPEAVTPEAAPTPVIAAAPPVEVSPRVPTMEAPAAPVEIKYQGGNSVWQEVEKQYAARYPGFDKLPAAEQTYLIDQIKDKIAASPDKFGLAEVDKVTAEQLKAVDWNEAFTDADMESPGLSKEQITNIENYKAPAESVEDLEARLQKEVMAEAPEAPAETPVEPAADAGAPVEVASTPLEQAMIEVTVASNPPDKLWWSDDMKDSFSYLYQDQAAALVKDPEALKAVMLDFNTNLTKTTEALKAGTIQALKLKAENGAMPVASADGTIHLLQPEAGGKKWLLWKVPDSGKPEIIVRLRPRTGLGRIFGGGGKEFFSVKEIKELLGYRSK